MRNSKGQFMKGNRLSIEHRKKISLSSLGNLYRTGKPAWNKGKKLTYTVWNKGIKTGIVPKSAYKKGHIPYSKKVAGLGIMESWNKGLQVLSMAGQNHFAWKGDEVSYRTLHKWVERNLGKIDRCEECGNESLKHRQYHWSNVSGNYKRIISDWRRLCVKCHKTFDAKRAKSLLQLV